MAGSSTGKPAVGNCGTAESLSIESIPYTTETHQNISTTQLIDLIATYPVLSSVRANQALLNYTGGIIKTCNISSEATIVWYDVQVIGYNQNDRYFLVKNSMGTDWGEEGYARISMENDCGLTRFVTVVANPAEPAWVASTSENILHYSIAFLLILSILMTS